MSRVHKRYPASPGTNTDVTKGLLLLAVTEEAVWLQCKIDALYWTLANQGKLKLAVHAIRQGHLEHEADKERIYGDSSR